MAYLVDDVWWRHKADWGAGTFTSLADIECGCHAAGVPCPALGSGWAVPLWVYAFLANGRRDDFDADTRALACAVRRLGPKGAQALFVVGGGAALRALAADEP